MKRKFYSIVVVTLAALISACAPYNPEFTVPEPPLPRPDPEPVNLAPPPKSGAIFSVSNHRPLFENRRARMPGDVLTIKIVEKTSASKTSNSSIDRQGSSEGSITALPFMKEGTLGKLGISGESANTFAGKGATDSNNDFNGQITVTVAQVMRNGNLVVAGEKQVGLNGNVDILRFHGVVNPSTILPDNSVLSSRVADARLDYSGRGQIKETQTMGWLSRFFLSFLPI
jgi:flagellar L-ring protein precursor FlgH